MASCPIKIFKITMNQDIQALLEQAENNHRQGKLSEAEAIYRKLLAADPRHPLINARLASLLHQTQVG